MHEMQEKNCGGHVEQEEILIFCRSFYIIASVIVMYRMSLKCCPKCKKVFYCGALSEDLWGVQGAKTNKAISQDA